MLAILGLILKFLPYVVPLLKGFFGALNNLSTAEGKEGAAQIDMEKLQKFIEEQTTAVIKNVVEKHRGELVAYVPTEEEAEREKKIDDLLAELEKAQKEYENSKEVSQPPQEPE